MTPTDAFRSALSLAARVVEGFGLDPVLTGSLTKSILAIPAPDFPPDPCISTLAQTIRAEIDHRQRMLSVIPTWPRVRDKADASPPSPGFLPNWGTSHDRRGNRRGDGSGHRQIRNMSNTRRLPTPKLSLSGECDASFRHRPHPHP